MKKFFICLMMASAMTAQAQIARFSEKTALEEIAADKFLAAGNMTDYDHLPRTALTPAPKGYEPYYLSHYGRHGARYLLEENDYAMPVQTLRKAKYAGKLTPLGDKVLAKLDSMQKTTKDRLGDLTATGQRQHHGIAKRMAQNFPEIFKTPNLPIHSVSTTSIRAIISMMAECEELQAANPSARIFNDASKADMHYMNYSPSRQERGMGMPQMNVMRAMQKQQAMSDSLKHPERLMQQLFNDQHWVYLNVPTGSLMSKIADVALNMQSHDGDATLLELFTPEELRDLWRSNNLYWYLLYSNAPQTGGKMQWNQKNLLKNIIETADTVTQTQVSLRFGHDTVVLPLLCMLDLDGSAVQVDNLDELENSFRTYYLIPTGSNVQFIFYRPKKGKTGDILVKVLFNEREAHMPLKTDTWPYYKWQDVREYYLAKLAEQEQKK